MAVRLGLTERETGPTHEDSGADLRPTIESGVVTGFQVAASSGPLCGEPMWGVAFEVDALVSRHDALRCVKAERALGPANHRLARCLSEGLLVRGCLGLRCTPSTLGRSTTAPCPGRSSPRLWTPSAPLSPSPTPVWSRCERAGGSRCAHGQAALSRSARPGPWPAPPQAMYLSEVTTSTEGLAGAYAALNRRRARILSEEAREGTDLFVIRAYLPVQASFGFAGELRMRSSGAATAQLMMSHWERLQVDPFFVPRTQEEREEFGEAGQVGLIKKRMCVERAEASGGTPAAPRPFTQGQGGTNLAADLIRQVRKRKGLPVEEKVVESATKQRTLAKKK